MAEFRDQTNKRSTSPILDWLRRHQLVDYFQSDVTGPEPTHDPNRRSAIHHGWLRATLPEKQFRVNLAQAHMIFWSPGELPEGASVLLASSRIGNQPDSMPDFFNALRTFACRFDAHRNFLLTQETIATHPYVERVAHLFNLPIVELKRMPKRLGAGWFTQRLAEFRRNEKHFIYFDFDESELESETKFQIDAYLFSIAREVRILNVRNKGNVHSAALERLEDGTEFKTYVLSAGPSLGAVSKLVERGAIRWYLFNERQRSDDANVHSSDSNIFSLSEFCQNESLEDFFLHWTRRRKGPWPNQSTHQFYDDLIMGEPSADHSRVASLTRIIALRKLIASNLVTRDVPVVCFSKLTVEMLPSRRTFRSHLGRWDFETVGIAIRRSVLDDLGIREVIYGDEDTWLSLPPVDRPYFQKNTGRSIDWSIEQEWRVVGDINLSKIPVNDAFVFVSTHQEAVQISKISYWPVVVLPRDGNKDGA